MDAGTDGKQLIEMAQSYSWHVPFTVLTIWFHLLHFKSNKNEKGPQQKIVPLPTEVVQGVGGSNTLRLLRLATMPHFITAKQLSLQMIQEDLFWKLWIFSFHASSCILDLVALNLPC